MNQHGRVDRTSPFGGPFIGKCAYCGKEGLTSKDLFAEDCPASPDFETCLIDALEEDETEHQVVQDAIKEC